MVIVFIGPPGCGKGTQANILKDTILPDLNILTVSSLLKEKSQDQSVLGKEIKNKMDNGDLIEDTVVISVLKEKVNTLTNEQILIDGFPRSSIQADSLVEIFANEVLSIINFEVDDDQLLQRIKKRSLEESRADDSFFEKNLSLVDWLRQWSKNDEEREEVYVRGFLGKMLFSGEEALKSCTVLSGGEKVRCMLSKMMMEKSNFLILNEPTNHLDLESITALNNSLINFKGNIFLTTQDFQFANSVGNRVIEIGTNGYIDKLMNFGEYLNDDKVKILREKIY